MDIAAIIESHSNWLRGEVDGIRANLSSADLRDADLRDADLRDAIIREGLKLGRNIGQASRGDHYTFLAFETDSGELFFFAGCRAFLRSEFESHIDREYPDSDKSKAARACLDYLTTLASAPRF